jgi:hypothetical protein
MIKIKFKKGKNEKTIGRGFYCDKQLRILSGSGSICTASISTNNCN